METFPKRSYQFGPYSLDPNERTLTRGGAPVALTPKAFDTLLALVQRAGHLVEKEELFKEVWPGTFVEDGNLAVNVFALRKALGAAEGGGEYIETVPKRGYRFTAEVRETDETESRAAAPTRANASAAPESGSRRWIKIFGIATLGFAVLVLAVVAASRYRSSHAAPGRLMLAVLPFENLTGDAGQEYFSDGLTEEMIAQVGRFDPQRVGVVARTSVMHYKRTQEGLSQIGRELGAQYVLEGSVRRDPSTVRITAQLIEVKNQTHVWSRQYDRELSSLLSLQTEIAQEISDEIQLTLGASKTASRAAPTPMPPEAFEIYDLYLKGRYSWNRRDRTGFEQSIQYLQRAVAKDPKFARAHAALADSYALMSSYNFAPATELMPKARAAALRALQIDETLAEAHTALALITENYDWDWATAEKEYQRAIQLDPNYATAHQWYAEYLTWVGRFDEAFGESERARQLDPLSLSIATDDAAIAYFSRQYDRAVKQLEAVLLVDPHFPRAHMVVYCYVEKGMFAEALGTIDSWHHSDYSPQWEVRAYVYARSGRRDKALEAMKKWEALNREHPRPLTSTVLTAYGALGEKEKALSLLEKAYAEHSTILTNLKVEPGFDPLRGEPRFQALLKRVGLGK